MGSDVSINVGQDVIRPIVEAKIQAAIVDQLSQEKRLVSAVVEQVLYSKVDHEGKPERYSGGIPYIQWVVERAVKEATKKAVDQVVAEQQEEFRRAVSVALTKKRGAIAENFINALLENTKHQWLTKVDVTFMPPRG